MSEEATIYEKGDIKITNLRAIFGTKTYSISNITAVEMQKTPASTGCASLIAVVGAALVVWQIITLVTTSRYAFKAGLTSPWTLIFIGAIMLIGGIAMSRMEKPSYSLKITTASGEISATSSEDKELVKNVTDALNDAIVRKG